MEPKIKVLYATEFGAESVIIDLDEFLDFQQKFKILSINYIY